jgi:hypothetical protein
VHMALPKSLLLYLEDYIFCCGCCICALLEQSGGELMRGRGCSERNEGSVEAGQQ